MLETVLFMALLYTAWTWSTTTRTPATTTLVNPATGVAKRDASRSADSVAAMHLFGTDAQTAQTVLRVIPQIEIAGILAADPEQDSVALLQVNGEAKSYQVNDRLPDGEVVEHIESAAVILGDAGRTRRIEMGIKFADSNAVFRKASIQGGDGSSWADAYLDDSYQQSPTGLAHGTAEILNVAATNHSHAPGISLQAIREERAARFSTFRKAKGAPPSPTPDDGRQ